jgi:hypothetical protein
MRRASPITEKTVDRSFECDERVVGEPRTAIDERPIPRRVAPDAGQNDRAPKVGALPRAYSKLTRGAWSWAHAQLLLGGPGDGPWDFRFVEDDYRRMARRRQANRHPLAR